MSSLWVLSSESIVSFESEEKYAQIESRLQAKTVQNCSKNICW